jgi:hypothetical protein
MTSPAWSGEWGVSPHRGLPTLSRRQARRWSRRFAGVGVVITAVRLQELSSGIAATDTEATDVAFALTATELQRQRHHTMAVHARAAAVQVVIVVIMALVVLMVLLAMGYAFLAAVAPPTA